VRDRNIQYLGELEQAARTDAVGAALVFLNLLKRQTDAVTHRALAHAKQRAALAHASADMNIDRMRPGHECVSLLVGAGLVGTRRCVGFVCSSISLNGKP